MRDWLSHRAETTPAATALIDAASDQRRSFADLDEAVDQTAGYLSAVGVEDGDHVGILVREEIAAIRLLWATMRLGAVSVPLRPAWDADALQARIAETDLSVVVCGPETKAAAASEVLEATVTVGEAEHEDVDRLSDRDPNSVTPSAWTQADPATIVFTAGSTGDPRPVILEMGNHLTNATDAAVRLGVLPTDRWLSGHPVHQINGLATVLRATLFGSALVVEEAEPGTLADTVDTYDVTCLSASPTVVSGMLNARGMLSDSLRTVLITGAPVPIALLDRCRGYSIPARAAYSVTEAAGVVTASRPGQTVAEPGSIGSALFRTELTVVDDEGTPLGHDRTGELVVAGPTVTPGYYDTETGGPVGREQYGVRTGDIGFRDEGGQVHLVSRRDDRLRVDGETVRSGDIREALCDHEDVDDAAVVGVPDGESGSRLGALIVRSDPALDAETLREYCQRRLAAFVVPEQFAFAAQLPLTPSGDVDRPAVREQLLDCGDRAQKPDN